MIQGSLETSGDEELVGEFQKGNEAAFDQLVRRYEERSIRLAFSMLRNWETSKEVSQNAFVKAYFGLARFKRQSKFGTWFYRIVINQTKDEIRRRARAKEEVRGEAILTAVESPGASPARELEREEERRRLEDAVAGLPPNEQRVFVMRYFNDLALQDISDALGIALGTVKASLFHATQKVRSRLEVANHEESRKF